MDLRSVANWRRTSFSQVPGVLEGRSGAIAIRRLTASLIGSLLIGAIIPYVIRVLSYESVELRQPVNNAFFGCLIAITLGYWLYRGITTYPGIEKSAYIIPSYTVSHGLLLFALIVSRIEYNRTLLICSYVLSIGWMFFIHSRVGTRSRMRIGYLPFGITDRLTSVSGVEWVPLHEPVVTSSVDAVAADLRVDIPSQWDWCLADFALRGTPVYHFKHLLESLTGRVELEHLSENSFGSLAPASAFTTAKLIFDWLLALVLGLALLPILLVVGAAVRLTSRGPALFRQTRIGYKGKPFTVYKFRTMTAAASTTGDPMVAAITVASDVRITPLGRFLRKTRIDELPQLLNILRGEMSLIGPRPEVVVLSHWYQNEIPFYRYRHIVRPGITGWAQVCQGHVAQLEEVKNKLHYDFYYIKNFSPWLDMLIVARTVYTMVTGFGHR